MLLAKKPKLTFSFHSVYVIQGAKPKTQGNVGHFFKQQLPPTEKSKMISVKV